MTSIETVTGQVVSEDLGFTLMHEHLFMISVGMFEQWPHLLDKEDALAHAVKALRDAKQVGVDTVVDLTTPNMGRDAELMARASRESGVNVLISTGVHPLLPLPLYMLAIAGPRSGGVNPDDVAELFVHDIEVGIGRTDIRAAAIKVGTDPLVDETNDRVLRGAARAQRQTGVPISTHTIAANKVGLAQQDIFEQEGVDLTRVIIGHSGDSDDLHYLMALANRGSYIGMDRFGYTMPGGHETLSAEERVAVIATMCSQGYAEKMVLSHDAVCWGDVFSDEYMQQYLSNWNLTYVPSTILGKLRDAGVSQDDIDTMTRINPRRIFEAQGGY